MMKRNSVSKTLTAIAFFAVAFIALPILALVWNVPWLHFFSTLSTENSRSAIWLSCWTSILAALISLLLGLPLAWYLAKGPQKIVQWVRPIVLSPIVLPPTVAGLGLLALFGRTGWIGSSLYQNFQWTIPFTSIAVVLAGVFTGLPFLTLIVESGFRQLQRDIEDAARTEGADSNVIFSKISIPQIGNVVITGLLLAWARAIGEFGATVMFAGSFPGKTQTWTMLVYQEMDVNIKSAYSLSVILLIISISVVYLLRKKLQAAFT